MDKRAILDLRLTNFIIGPNVSDIVGNVKVL